MTVVQNGVELHCLQGDIARQNDIDVVVNAANHRLMPGGGVAGALHRAAGPGLAEECQPLAPIKPGEAVLTGAHRLPNRAVVHCLGPVYGQDEPAAELLERCYREALRLADAAGFTSIAFPALSTGAFGYPVEDAARVAFRTVLSASAGMQSIREVRFVLFSAGDAALHDRVLADIAG